MKATLLTFCLLSVSSAFVFTNPPIPVEYPLWSHLSQINLFENLQPEIWLKNYSLVVASSPCPPVASSAEQALIPGRILIYSYSESGGRCSYREVTAAFNAFDPIGHLFFNYFGFIRAIGTNNPYAPVPNDHPVWHTGANPALPFSQSLPSVPFALFEPNATITLTFPTQSGALQALHHPSWQQTSYAVVALGIVGMLMATWKLSIFIHSFGIELSIPQVVLACCFCSSFFLFLSYGLFGNSVGNTQAIVPHDAQDALSLMHVGFTFTAMIIMGFYFVEISHLTTSQAVTGISKLKIPAAIFIVILWIVVLSTQAVDASDPVFTGSNVSQVSLGLFFWAWTSVIVPFMATAILAFGSVSLLLALRTASNQGPVLRIVILSTSVIILVWPMFLITTLLFYAPDIDIFTSPLFRNQNLYEFLGLRSLLQTICIISINVLLSLNFSVTVQKEIEMSKSGTSSTSGSSGSSSSSSSSSSAADPVIEL